MIAGLKTLSSKSARGFANSADAPATPAIDAEKTELQLIVREEVRAALRDAWPTTTGQVKGMQVPNGNYREQILQK